MLYELHLTVDPTTDILAWGNWCVERGIKPLEIHLASKAASPVQKMFATTFQGTDSEAFIWMDDLIRAAQNSDYEYDDIDYSFDEQDAAFQDFGTQVKRKNTPGYKVIRAKLEVPLDKASKYTNAPYHECHVKSLIEPDNVGTLVKFAESLGWSASTNVLYPSADGLEKWYFTQRTYGEGYLDSAASFKDAFAALPTDAFQAVRMESEAVVYDTNPGLDKGWA